MQSLELVRMNPAIDMQRFYRMEIVRGLFGNWGLVREWGRLGSSGRMRTDWFDSLAEAKDARFLLHMQKAMRGYE